MKTSAVFFPFDLFGGGSRAGVELLADAFEELLADNKREKVPTRARAYAGKVRFTECLFETLADYQDWRPNARTIVREAFERRDFLLWVAGNHLGALPVYDELSRDTLVVQLDAHLDVANLSDCTSELSHGNFLLHRAGPLPRVVNVGHRDLLLKPDYVLQHYHRTHAAADLLLDPQPVLDEIRTLSAAADRVLLDIDCDVLDPAHFAATPQPVPFGLDPALLLRCLDAAFAGRVVGLSISEFDPARDQGDRCLSLLMWLIEYVLLRLYEKR